MNASCLLLLYIVLVSSISCVYDIYCVPACKLWLECLFGHLLVSDQIPMETLEIFSALKTACLELFAVVLRGLFGYLALSFCVYCLIKVSSS